MVRADVVESVAAAVTLFVAVGAVVLAVLGVVAVRASVRSYRRLRQRARAVLSPGALAARVAPAGSPTWWLAQRDRVQMWRSVAAAEHAVSAATRAGAPTGELPALVLQLRRSALDVDQALRGASCAPRRLGNHVHSQVQQVRDAAENIRAVATETAAAFARPSLNNLTEAVRVEVDALRFGLQAISTRP
jgi:hypothetical protein